MLDLIRTPASGRHVPESFKTTQVITLRKPDKPAGDVISYNRGAAGNLKIILKIAVNTT